MPERKFVQSVRRACRIVELVTCSDAGLTLSELADSLGLPPNTTYYLADTLVENRVLDKTERSRRYRLGPALGELLALHRTRDRHQRLLAAVRGLALQLPAVTVTGFEVRGGEMVMVARVGPPRRSVVEYLDTTMPPYINASSLLHLSTLSREARARYEMRHPFAEFATGIWESRDHLEACLQQVRAQEYAAVARDEAPLGRTVAVAAPIWSVGNQLEGALGNHGPLQVGEDLAVATQRTVRHLQQAIAEQGLSDHIEGEALERC